MADETKNKIGDVLAGFAAGPGAVTQRREQRARRQQEAEDKAAREGLAKQQAAQRQIEDDPASPQNRALQDTLMGIFFTDRPGDAEFIRSLTQKQIQESGLIKALTEQAKLKRQFESDKLKATQTAAKQTLNLTKGEEAIDRDFAKEVATFEARGGKAEALKDISQLRSALDTLRSGKNITGPIVGRVPGQSVFNPTGVAVKDAVEQVVQKTLRETLGAQFGEKEGERLIQKAFNPALEEEENIKRVQRLLNATEKRLQAKEAATEFFKQNGTLKGFQAPEITLADIEAELEQPATSADGELTPEEQAELEQLRQELGR